MRVASTRTAQRIGKLASVEAARSSVRNTPFSIAGSISSVLEAAVRLVEDTGQRQGIVQEGRVVGGRGAGDVEQPPLHRRPDAQRAPEGRVEGRAGGFDARDVRFEEPGAQGHVGGHQARGDAGAQHQERRVRVRAQVVVDAVRKHATAVRHLAQVAAHDREPAHARGEVGVLRECDRQVRERADGDDLEPGPEPRELEQRVDRVRGLERRVAAGLEDALALVAEPVEAAAREQRRAATGVDGDLRAAGQLEQAPRHARAQQRLASHVGDRRELELGGRERERQAQRVVDIRRHVGVEDDGAAHPSSTTATVNAVAPIVTSSFPFARGSTLHSSWRPASSTEYGSPALRAASIRSADPPSMRTS